MGGSQFRALRAGVRDRGDDLPNTSSGIKHKIKIQTHNEPVPVFLVNLCARDLQLI